MWREDNTVEMLSGAEMVIRSLQDQKIEYIYCLLYTSDAADE